MPTDWTTLKLRQLIGVRHGFAFASEYFAKAGPYVLLTPGNFREAGGFRWLDDKQKYYTGPVPRGFVLNAGDMLVAMTEQAPGLLGSTFFVPNDGRSYLHNQRLGAIDVLAPSKLDPSYLHYLLSTTPIRKEISAGAGGTKVRHTSPGKLLSIEVELPRILKQRRVVELLRNWDEAIDKTERLISAKEKQFAWFRAHLLTGKRRSARFKCEWRVVRLNEVLVEHGFKSTGKETVFSVSVHKGLINQVDHLGRSFAAKKTGHYNRVKPGDIVYTKSPTGDFPLGIIKQSNVVSDVIVSPLYGVFTPATRELGTDSRRLFRVRYKHPQLSRSVSAEGSKEHNRDHEQAFPRGETAIPLDPMEQAALAKAVITAKLEIELLEGQVAAIRRQKRGLMQKLLTGTWQVSVHEDAAEDQASRVAGEAAG